MVNKRRDAPSTSHPTDSTERVEPKPSGRRAPQGEEPRLEDEEEDVSAVGPLSDV